MTKKSFYLPCLCLLGIVTFAKADTLHGFCYGSSSCSDNGTNTPTSTNPPQFGFNVAPGPQTGDYFVDFLIQDNAAKPGSITVNGTKSGPLNNMPLSGTASLFSSTPWTSGQLDAYLGISASPSNPIGAFILDPGSTGFFVFQVDLGTNTLAANPDSTTGPLLSLITGLPIHSYIVGFLNVGSPKAEDFIGTANSGAIYETGAPAPVPEPGSLLLVCSGLVGAAVSVRRQFGR
jgi:hypothetical protein